MSCLQKSSLVITHRVILQYALLTQQYTADKYYPVNPVYSSRLQTVSAYVAENCCCITPLRCCNAMTRPGFFTFQNINILFYVVGKTAPGSPPQSNSKEMALNTTHRHVYLPPMNSKHFHACVASSKHHATIYTQPSRSYREPRTPDTQRKHPLRNRATILHQETSCYTTPRTRHGIHFSARLECSTVTSSIHSSTLPHLLSFAQ